MRTFAGVENCWRMEAADKADDAFSYDGSRSTTITRVEGWSRVSQ